MSQTSRGDSYISESLPEEEKPYGLEVLRTFLVWLQRYKIMSHQSATESNIQIIPTKVVSQMLTRIEGESSSDEITDEHIAQYEHRNRVGMAYQYKVPNTDMHLFYEEYIQYLNKINPEVNRENHVIGGPLFIVERLREPFKLYFDFEHSTSNQQYNLSEEDVYFVANLVKEIIMNIYARTIVSQFDRKRLTRYVIQIRDTNHFHIHFPGISVNKIIAKNISKEISLQLQNDIDFINRHKLETSKFVDSSYGNGLRLIGCNKHVHGGSWQTTIYKYASFNILENGQFGGITYSPYITLQMLSDLTILTQQTKITDMCPDFETFGDCLDIREPKNPESTKQENDIIERIKTELIEYGNPLEFRNTQGRLYIFNTNGHHRCPVDDEIFHDRENIYAIVDNFQVIIKCFCPRCNHKKRILFKLDTENEYLTRKFDIQIINEIISDYNLSGQEKKSPARYEEIQQKIILYINRHFACVPYETNARFIGLEYNDSNCISRIHTYSKQSIDFYLDVNLVTGVYVNQSYRPVILNLIKLWLKSINKRMYSSVVFDPDPDYVPEPDKLNSFLGFTLSRQQLEEYYATTDHEKIEETILMCKHHIFRQWCCGNYEEFEYILNWFAHLIQKPHVKTTVAVIINGAQGSGKSQFFGTFMKPYYGEYYYKIQNFEAVRKFNNQLEDRILVVFDEANTSGRNESTLLKTLITETTMVTEAKFRGHETHGNYINFVFLSNNDRVINIERNERRYIMLTSNLDKLAYTNRSSYFSYLWKLDWRAWIWYLMFNKPLNMPALSEPRDFHPQFDLISTEALRRTKRATLTNYERYILRTLETETILDGVKYKRSSRVKVRISDYIDLFRKEYPRQWDDVHDNLQTTTARIFKTHLSKVTDEDGSECYLFPTISRARQAWREHTREPDWDFSFYIKPEAPEIIPLYPPELINHPSLLIPEDTINSEVYGINVDRYETENERTTEDEAEYNKLRFRDEEAEIIPVNDTEDIECPRKIVNDGDLSEVIDIFNDI